MLRILSRRPTLLLVTCLLAAAAVLGTGCHGDGGGAAGPGAPAAISTTPGGGATSVPVNAGITTTFNTPMAPLNAADFTLRQGTTPVPGTVTTGADGLSATFTPGAALAASTVYTATISGQAMTLAGAPLSAGRVWSFTTGTVADTAAPTVTSKSPAALAGNVAMNSKVVATFSEAMKPSSLNGTTFRLMLGATPVVGSVAYGPGTTATFTPNSPLTAESTYTSTISTGAQDLQGNALELGVTWTFTTGSSSAMGPAPVGLGTAGNFAVLAKTAVSTVPFSTITGHVGVSPAAASFLTGFSLVADSTNVFSTSTQVTGQAFASNYAVPTPSNLTTAVSNMEAAYTDAASRPTPDHTELGSGTIGGLTLAPGLYKWTSTVSIPTSITIAGGANDVWIFQTSGDLTQAAGTTVILSGGARARNIFWQVAGAVVVGANSHLEGIILCQTEVTLQTGASLNGRILAQSQVALQQATVAQPGE